MSDMFWLSECQFAKMHADFQLAYGALRVYDRRVISGFIHVMQNGLRWRDAPADNSPCSTLYDRFVRWSRLGVFKHIYNGLAVEGGRPDTLMIDATHLIVNRAASSLLRKACAPSYRAYK